MMRDQGVYVMCCGCVREHIVCVAIVYMCVRLCEFVCVCVYEFVCVRVCICVAGLCMLLNVSKTTAAGGCGNEKWERQKQKKKKRERESRCQERDDGMVACGKMSGRRWDVQYVCEKRNVIKMNKLLFLGVLEYFKNVKYDT